MVMIIAGAMALSGFSADLPNLFPGDVAVVHAASGQNYNTVNGIADFGQGGAHIDIKGNSGQTLVGKQFRVYQIFFAENAKGGESINYTFNPVYAPAIKNVVAKALSKSGKPTTADQVTEYMAIDYIQTLNSHPVEGVTAPQELEGRYSKFRYFVEDLRNEIERLNIASATVTVKNVMSGAENTIRLDGLAYGYYIIDEISKVEDTHSAGSLCMVDTANPTAQITIKSDYPSVTKKIQEDDKCKDISNVDRWNDIGDYEIGQNVPYQFTSNVPDMNGYDTYYYAWHDVMSPALTFQKDSVQIQISGTIAGKAKTYTLASSEYAVTEKPGNGDTFMVAITDLKAIVDREFDQMNQKQENIYGQKVVLTYAATLNEKAAEDTGRPGFENDVRLEFSNDADSEGDGSTGYTPWDTVVCFTYRLNPLKTNDHDKVLAGAKFRLYSDEACKNEVFVKAGNDGYIVINRDAVGGTDHTGGNRPTTAVEMVSDANGTFTIFGLDSGIYYLKETDAPDGYRPLLDPIKLELTATFTKDRDSYIKGDGATEKTLVSFDASANIKTFFDGIGLSEDKELETNVEEGSANLTIINKVGKKLPITGTPALTIIITVGTVLMTGALVKSRKRKEEKL